MNKHQYDEELMTLDTDDFAGGYLRQEDVPSPLVVTIRNARSEALPGQQRKKLALVLDECDKPFIVNTTNRERLKALFGRQIIRLFDLD